MSSQKIILIAGPTAAGKSALALDIARRGNGTIINADAMQVYASLPILTAQPSDAEQKEIPHELYAVLDPSRSSSAGTWRALALAAIEKTLAMGRTPLLVGGTGLYFRALLGGLADIPDIPAGPRAQAHALYEKLGEEQFRRALGQRDPASATHIAKNDRQRLVRAFEVVTHTGKTIGEWQQGSKLKVKTSENTITLSPGLQNLKPEIHFLLPPRDQLYAACDRRFAAMIERGAVEEVRQFMARKLDPTLPAGKIIGVRELAACLQGEIALEHAIAKGQQATRNYVKRQTTWFRHQWSF